MNSFWNDRFMGDEYFYGITPNTNVKNFIDTMNGGRILFPGEGEGRNAVYAAMQGYDVVAFDQSSEAKRKALLLAKQKETQIEYFIGDILESSLQSNSFDAIVLCFFHLPNDIRLQLFPYFIDLLKPGGQIFIVGFSTEQLTNGYKSGGPKELSMLYSQGLLSNDFRELNIEENKIFEGELDEGKGHQGLASLVVFKAKKC